MIEELRIKDLGVIEHAHVQFGPGLNALTGETGAGKTMALTSLMMLMGAKIDSAKVRAGAQAAVVDGTFVVDAHSPAIDIVRNAGGDVDIDDDQAVIYVSRHVPASGRTRAYVGGQAVPLAILKQLSEHLVTVHGQKDQLRLTAPQAQRNVLDAYGGTSVGKTLEKYRDAWETYQTMQRERDEFAAKVAQAGTEKLALQAFIKRVDAVRPVLGEEEELKKRAMVLENVEDVRNALTSAAVALDAEETGALYNLDRAAYELAKISTTDPSLAELVTVLREVSSRASDVSNELGVKRATLDADPEQLNAIHERRAELRSLQRDLGMGIADIIERRETADERLAAIADPQANLGKMTQDVNKAWDEVERIGTKLSEQRTASAKKLGTSVTRELTQLAMKDATFSVSVTRANEARSHGLDDIECQLAPHRGSKLLPLGNTASGGEMSRVMLALEVVLADGNSTAEHTFIFDEVDAGIGGKTALSIGERLALLGRGCQVIAVTHLAQVAAYASRHLTVEKNLTASGGLTNVKVLDADERVAELARMLSGHEESEAALTHAAELLSTAHVS